MKNKLATLIVSIFILFTQKMAYAITPVDHLPAEIIVLKLPNDGCANWKEISRSVTKKTGLVERIPFNQTTKNWSELIGIQYFDRSALDKKVAGSVENALDRIRETTLSAYPGNKVTWRIIEKNENDILYEWILHNPYGVVPPEHEIARLFLTNIAFHRVGFTRRNSEMNSDERETWIKLLKESASVVSMKEAIKVPGGLSIADSCKGH